MDAGVWVVLILAAVAVVFGVLFRHKIRLALKGPGGTGLDIEGENAPRGRTPPPDGAPAGQGARSINIGRDSKGSVNVAGDNNVTGGRNATGDRNRVR